MADRPSVKDILARVRAAGPAKPDGDAPAAEAAPAAEPASYEPEPAPAEEPVAAEPAPAVSAPPPNVPTPSQLGRPLTLKEKLAAARAGGAAQPAAAAPVAAPVAKAPAPAAE